MKSDMSSVKPSSSAPLATARLAVIGAGQIGSRHLQALALLDRPVSLEIVDPNPASLETAKARLAEIPAGPFPRGVQYHSSLENLSPDLDLAIVATHSDIREQVVTDLLAAKRVRYLVLEKLLFQSLGSYERVASLLKRTGVKAWVNCPRRLWPEYIELKARLAGFRWLDLSVTGTQWGLGSNAIHFLDLLSFLSGPADFTLFAELLDPVIPLAKRPGYVEFGGTLCGTSSRNGHVVMTVHPGENVSSLLQFTTDHAQCTVNELEGKAWYSEAASDWNWTEIHFPRMMQSRLTNEVAQALLDKGDCGLTPYEESSRLHQALLSVFLAHLKRAGKARGDSCPLT